MQLNGIAPEPVPDAWDALTRPLGLAGAAVGQRVQAHAGAPSLAGLVERVGPPEHPGQLLRLDEPAPGLAHLFALPMGGIVYLSIRFFLFGADAPAAAAHTESVWQPWLNQHFPVPTSSPVA